MTNEDYYGKHISFYFLVMAIGGAFIWIGKIHPVYDVETATVKTPYTPFFIVFGIILIVLSFIGLIFFSENREGTDAI